MNVFVFLFCVYVDLQTVAILDALYRVPQGMWYYMHYNLLSHNISSSLPLCIAPNSFCIFIVWQTETLDGAFPVPDIKLHSNPSAFNVYCNVRHSVLDWQQKEAVLALASRSSVQSGDSDSEEEEEYREPAVKLPKVSG